ncbi:MAG: helix-turn-helix domain-containing protein [Acutalibacteraceae bacterium]
MANENENSFDITDYCLAKEVFAAWQVRQNQQNDDFLLRQRKAELNALVKRVIENECKSSEKVLIDLKWNKNLSNEEIAKILSIDSSTVYRRLEKITDTLYEKLKYVLEYRFGRNSETAAVLIKKQVPRAVRTAKQNSIPQRLKSLRESSAVSLIQLSELTEIPPGRLAKLESGEKTMTVGELIALAEFFKVSADYILFGKERVLRDPLTGLPTKCVC